VKSRILLIDDDPAVRESLGLALESEGYQVISASDGQEGLTRFYDGYVDIVLLDLNTPVLSGWDTFERITAVNPSIPVIIITARADQYDKAALAGATALMEKPLHIPMLLRTIQRLLDEPAERRIERIVAHKTMMLMSMG
jgi:DNA-binding response OmpR family regulator